MLLIQNGSILTMDEHDTIHTPGWVWVEKDRIGAVGAGQPPSNLMAGAERVIDATHLAVLPGNLAAVYSQPKKYFRHKSIKPLPTT